MSCIDLPFFDLHQSRRYYPGRTPTQPVDLAVRCSSYQAEHENWQAENNIQTIVSSEELTFAHKSKSIHTVVAVTDDERSGVNEQIAPLHGHQDDRLSDGDTPGHNTWIPFSIHPNAIEIPPTSSIECRVRRSSEPTDVRNCVFARNISLYPMLYAPPFEKVSR